MEMQASNENESYNKARGLPPPVKSAVRLHINVERKPPAKEVIRKVTQAHEVVEVDGFVFKRKRSNTEGIPSVALQQQSAEKKPRLPVTDELASSPLTAVTAALAPTVEAAEEAADDEAAAQDAAAEAANITPMTAQRVSAATIALLEQLPTDLSQSDRLASLCELLCAAELEELSASGSSEQLEPAVANVVQHVLASFVRSVQSAAADGRFQEEEPLAEAQAVQQQDAAEDDVVFKVDLEARKAGLRAQLAAFTKEEEEWQEVLAQQDTWQQAAEPLSPQPQGQPGHIPPPSVASLASGGGPDAGAMMPADNAHSNAAAAEADGHSMQVEAADALVPAGAEQAAPVLAVESGRLLGVQAGVLRKAEVDAHRKVAMQVEGLCSMVSGVEELVAKAERHCTAMQAKYHQERFRTYPHVDSPAKLIQELLKPGGTMTVLPK